MIESETIIIGTLISREINASLTTMYNSVLCATKNIS